MTNTEKLKDWINENHIDINSISNEMGINSSLFEKKVNNDVEFTISEIALFEDLYHMSISDCVVIFFSSM